MKIDVAKNARRNIFVGVMNKTVLLIIPYITKMIINRVLGAEYLGLNSLFNSILSVLTLSEMGFGSVIVYHMYKPIAEENYAEINALLSLYRKIYRIIGIVITVVGFLILPFLPKLISGDCPDNIDLVTIYIIYLLNTSLSYLLFGYKQSLLIAYQRDDINSIINLITQVILQLVQIIILIKTYNYYLYILCMPLFTVANNICVAYFTNKMFPYAKCEGALDKDTLSNLKKLIIGSFIQKACATTRNSLDSICISAFVGLTFTAIYSNYFTVFNGITIILIIIATSTTGGIGNHVIIKSVDDNFGELKKIDLLYMMLSGWCTVCLLCLSQPFMELWMGRDMLFQIKSVINMCVYFYVLKLGDIRGVYYTATGMWWKMRYRSIFETISNFLLDIVLGYFWGINGIILATTISIIFFNFIWGANIVFDSYFGKEKIAQYFIYHLKFALYTIIACFATYFICIQISISSLIMTMFVRGIICTLFGGGVMFSLNCRDKIFKEAIMMVKKDNR